MVTAAPPIADRRHDSLHSSTAVGRVGGGWIADRAASADAAKAKALALPGISFSPATRQDQPAQDSPAPFDSPAAANHFDRTHLSGAGQATPVLEPDRSWAESSRGRGVGHRYDAEHGIRRRRKVAPRGGPATR